MLRLYRAVSKAEFADIASIGAFRPNANSLAGKWFAESAGAAKRWGELLSPNELFHVIQVDVDVAVTDRMFRLPNLDQIGPARYAEGEILNQLNQQHLGISEVPLIVTGGP